MDLSPFSLVSIPTSVMRRFICCARRRGPLVAGVAIAIVGSAHAAEPVACLDLERAFSPKAELSSDRKSVV